MADMGIVGKATSAAESTQIQPDRYVSDASSSERTPEMDPRVKRGLAVDEYIAKHPIVESASFASHSGGHTVVKARLSTASYKTQSKTYYNQNFYLPSTKDDNVCGTIEGPMESASEEVKMSSSSKCSSWTVNFRATDINGKKKRFVDVLNAQSGLYDQVDVTDIHSDFLSGDHWGNPVWLPTSGSGHASPRILAYMAEQHPPNWKDDDKPYTAYTYVPNFGEQLSNQTRPGVFLLDFSRRGATLISPVQAFKDHQGLAHTMLRQPALAPLSGASNDTITLYVTGSSLLPDGRRLGGIYCSNRPEAIYEVNLEIYGENVTTKARKVSSKQRSARYPSVITFEGQSSLVYISNRRGYEHDSCAMLHKRTLPITANLEEEAQESDILVDVVSKPKDPKAFPGLYPSTVPRLLVECQPYLVIESAWRSRTTIVAVNVKDGSIHDLGNAQGINQTASHRLMATDGKSRILAIKTSLISPPKLLLGSFTSESTNSDPEIQWTIVKEWVYDFVNNDEIAFSHEKLHSTVIPLPGWNGTEALVVSPQPLDKVPTLPQNHVQALCVGKTAQADSASTVIPPLIMFAHGGPCSVFTSVWNLMSCLAWAAAGYTMAFVNYPGSTGFGQDCIEELSKDCGNLEVKAVVKMKQHLISLGIGLEEKGKRLYLGGSHSGFIGAHLGARYPEEFDAIDIRNPVIDLPSMFATSDIPDWNLSQLGHKYDFENPPAFVPADVLEDLRKRSPSYFAEKLFAENDKPCMPPTQIRLGLSDLRVPSNQGKAWYHALKGHGEPVNMLVFPDNGHPLETVWASRKSLHAQLDFLVSHTRF